MSDDDFQWQLEFTEQHPISGSKIRHLWKWSTNRDDRIHYSQFDLECIDLFLSDIGYVLNFYALSPTILVLVDYAELTANVKQTAILLDTDFYTGSHFLERTYCVSTTVAFFFVQCVVGEQQCVIFAPPNNARLLNGGQSTFCCHLLPKQPWSAASDRNISMFVHRVSFGLHPTDTQCSNAQICK
ncbi:hypothetical protein COOONC_18783 [Cooperia oncophora]